MLAQYKDVAVLLNIKLKVAGEVGSELLLYILLTLAFATVPYFAGGDQDHRCHGYCQAQRSAPPQGLVCCWGLNVCNFFLSQLRVPCSVVPIHVRPPQHSALPGEATAGDVLTGQLSLLKDEDKVRKDWYKKTTGRQLVVSSAEIERGHLCR